MFGNDWDGAVTAYAEGDNSGKSCQMPCGCTDVAWVGPAADHIAVACDDGNVVVIALSSIGADGWKHSHMFADHDNTATSVSASPLAPESLASSSLVRVAQVSTSFDVSILLYFLEAFLPVSEGAARIACASKASASFCGRGLGFSLGLGFRV